MIRHTEGPDHMQQPPAAQANKKWWQIVLVKENGAAGGHKVSNKSAKGLPEGLKARVQGSKRLIL